MTRSLRAAVAALLAVSFAWAAALVATPYLVSRDSDDRNVRRAAGVVYALSSFLCHQRPERSFRPWDVQFPVCARCQGIYLAAPFGVMLLVAAPRRRSGGGADALASRVAWQRVLVVACLPTMLTLVWEWTTGEMTPGIVRALAGGALGAAIAALVAAVIVGDLR